MNIHEYIVRLIINSKIFSLKEQFQHTISYHHMNVLFIMLRLCQAMTNLLLRRAHTLLCWNTDMPTMLPSHANLFILIRICMVFQVTIAPL